MTKKKNIHKMFNKSSIVISKFNYTVIKLDFKIVMWLKTTVFYDI